MTTPSPSAPGRTSLIHMALPEDWEAAQASGSYGVSTRGSLIADAGFMHACWDADQTLHVCGFAYSDRPDVVVLEIALADLATAGLEVREEPGDPTDPDSERFPHVYGGPIPTSLMRVREGGLAALQAEAPLVPTRSEAEAVPRHDAQAQGTPQTSAAPPTGCAPSAGTSATPSPRSTGAAATPRRCCASR